MKVKILFAGIVAASVVCPLAAQAQGVPDGIAHGAYVGGQTAGPVGGFVGGVVGGVIGGINGLFGIRPVSYSPGIRPRVYWHHPRWRRHVYRHVRHHKKG
ncbi:MAG: hypothetical protein ACRECV_20375 [Xanthobacteraceae bacterium]